MKICQKKSEKSNFRKQFKTRDLGTLIESFSTEQSFFTAVEVTAGGRLFNHVVTTSSIGNAYLEEMNKMKLQGEVTFLPLDRLQARRENYPRASDALPLIDKIEYEERFRQSYKIGDFLNIAKLKMNLSRISEKFGNFYETTNGNSKLQLKISSFLFMILKVSFENLKILEF